METQKSLNFLISAAQAAPSADNTQPWRLVRRGECLSLLPRGPAPGAPGFPAEHPAIQLALGAAAENLLQAAEQIGLIEPIILPDAGHSDIIIEVRVPPRTDFPLPDIALFNRHTNRFPYQHDPLPEAVLNWARTQSEGTATALVFDRAEPIRALAELTRRASEVRFQTQEIHEWLAASFRFTPEEVARGDGLDVSTIDLPPGGRWLLRFVSDWRRMAILNRLGAYKAFAHLEGKSLAQAPALLAIVGKPGLIGARSAGRLMQRVWIELNHRGVAVQPFYVVPDQLQRLAQGKVPLSLAPIVTQVARELGDILELRDQTPYMLLRVGFPTKAAKRSMRLPLDRVLTIIPQ